MLSFLEGVLAIDASQEDSLATEVKRMTMLELKEKAKWLEIESQRLTVLAEERNARKVQYNEAFVFGRKEGVSYT